MVEYKYTEHHQVFEKSLRSACPNPPEAFEKSTPWGISSPTLARVKNWENDIGYKGPAGYLRMLA